MKTYINNLTPKELEAAKENVMIKYRKPEKTLDSLLAIPGEQIISQEYDFSWKEKVVNEISLITQEKLLNFYYSTFEDNPEVISVIMKGENKKE
jgi:secreted Zn-dependent insulinase-like peptidase